MCFAVRKWGRGRGSVACEGSQHACRVTAKFLPRAANGFGNTSLTGCALHVWFLLLSNVFACIQQLICLPSYVHAVDEGPCLCHTDGVAFRHPYPFDPQHRNWPESGPTLTSRERAVDRTSTATSVTRLDDSLPGRRAEQQTLRPGASYPCVPFDCI